MKLNKIWLVLVPTEKSEMVDVVIEVSLVELSQMFLGGMKTESIMAAFTEESEAVEMAAHALTFKKHFKEAQ